MFPPTHPLIEAVTEPLADNAERRMAARALLGERFDAGHPGVADTEARLGAAGRRKFPALRKALPWIAAAVAFAAAIYGLAPMLRFIAVMEGFNIYEHWKKPPLPPGLTAEQRLLLGDPELGDLEQKRRLHLQFPDNPAYFSEYAHATLTDSRGLPPDYLENAARIAPENAFFTYVAAGKVGKESFEKVKTSTPSPPPRIVDGVDLGRMPREMEFNITDPAAFEKALGLVEKATLAQQFESYSSEMISTRTRILPTRNLADIYRSLIYAYSTPMGGIIQLRYASDLMSARAEQLSKSGRKAEFIALAAQREALIAHLGRNPDVILVGELVHAVIAAGTAKNFEAAADRLGLAGMAETYRTQSEAFQRQRDLRRIRSSKEEDPFPEEKASMLGEMIFPMIQLQVNEPPPISDSDFEPMRMAEHEVLGGLGLLAVTLAVGICALLVFLYRFVAAPIIRLPAKRMAGVLGAVDWAWVLLGGVAAPILFFLTVSRFTPLGGRGYGAAHFTFLFPGVHLATLLLGLFIAPAAIVRWRLAKRLGPFRFGDRFAGPIAFFTLAVLVAWSLAALPFLERVGFGQYTLAAIAAPPALCLVLLLGNALRGLLGNAPSRLAQCATAVAVLPAHALAIVALCATTPIHSAAEKAWVAKETLLRIDPDAPDLGAYEFKVAAQVRREITSITGVK